MKLAENGDLSVCEVVYHDYLRVFPKTNTYAYIATLVLLSAIITLITVYFSNWIVGLNVFAPAFGIAKTVVDHILLKNADMPVTMSYTAEETEQYTSDSVHRCSVPRRHRNR